jgi:hypothetical protein
MCLWLCLFIKSVILRCRKLLSLCGIANRWMIMEYLKNDREEKSTLKNLLQCRYVHLVPNMKWPGTEPGSRCWDSGEISRYTPSPAKWVLCWHYLYLIISQTLVLKENYCMWNMVSIFRPQLSFECFCCCKYSAATFWILAKSTQAGRCTCKRDLKFFRLNKGRSKGLKFSNSFLWNSQDQISWKSAQQFPGWYMGSDGHTQQGNRKDENLRKILKLKGNPRCM